jgi:hypothetical protein
MIMVSIFYLHAAMPVFLQTVRFNFYVARIAITKIAARAISKLRDIFIKYMTNGVAIVI